MLISSIKPQQFVFGVLGDTQNSRSCMLSQACASH